jgi:uncharacterized delta-60 repeat protein
MRVQSWKKRTKPATRRPRFQPRVEALEDRRLLSAGSLDFNFGHDGLVTVENNAVVKGIAVQGDGKIVVLDQTQTGYDLVRLNSNGSVDNSFGTGGIVSATFGDFTEVVNLAVFNNGTIAVGGQHGSGSTFSVDVAEFNSDGSVDTGFGTNGLAEVSGVTAADMAVFNNGGIVVIGASGSDMAVVYFNANGSPNQNFGTNGVVTTALGNWAEATGVALQANGQIVVSGYGDGGLALVRYNSDGSLDSNFGNGGVVTASLQGTTFEGSRVAIQGSNGKIVVTVDSFSAEVSSDTEVALNNEWGQEYFALLRFNDDGSVDSHFGKDGQVTSSTWAYQQTLIHNVVLQQNGKIIIGANDSYSSVVTRYNANGSVDLAYGNGGSYTLSWSSWGSPTAPVLAFQGNGELLVGGTSSTWDANSQSQNTAEVTRLKADSDPRPTQFGSEDAFKEYLIDQAVQQYSWYFGQTFQQWWWWGWGRGIDFAGSLAPNVSLDAAGTSTGNTISQTNTQVQGVDEGDTVKTDGQYLYVLSGNELVILNAWPADQLQIVSETQMVGTPIGEYLDGSHLTVISQDYRQVASTNGGADTRPVFYYDWGQPIVDVTVYDISNPAAPQVVEQNTLDGNYENSRAIGDTVYVAVNSYLSLPMPEYTDGWGNTITYETEAAYRARLMAMPIDALLPHYQTTWTDAAGSHSTSGLLTTAADIYEPGVSGELNLLSLVSFDMTVGAAGPTHSVSFLTSYDVILYGATDNFYLINNEWSYTGDWTFINQLSLQNGGIQLAATGRVPGTIINQFSVGEDGAYFDIATTTYSWASDSASNDVYVLTDHGPSLDIVGHLGNLAPGMTIRSVWFMGNRGYLDISNSYDPLLTIDLSDPTAPRATGKLEMPGWVGYLQPLDANHLLGIGYDGQEGLVISIFDVSDMTNPTLVSQYKVNSQGGWAWSDTTDGYDYHAITWYPQYQALTLPVNTDQYVAGSDGQDGGWIYQNAQLVFHVDLTAGTLSVLGAVSDASTIHRGVFINDVLYSISDTSVQAHSLNDLTTQIAQVSLPGPAPDYWWWGRPIFWTPVRLLFAAMGGAAIDLGIDNTVSITIGQTTGGLTRHTGGYSIEPGSGGRSASSSATGTDTMGGQAVILGSLPFSATTGETAPGGSTVAGTSVGEQAAGAIATVPNRVGTPGATTAQESGGGQDSDVSTPLGSDDNGNGDGQIREEEQESGGDVTLPGQGTMADGLARAPLAPRLVEAVFSDEPETNATPGWALTAILLLNTGRLTARTRARSRRTLALDAADEFGLE